jgi:hypothetical protein
LLTGSSSAYSRYLVSMATDGTPDLDGEGSSLFRDTEEALEEARGLPVAAPETTSTADAPVS